MAEVCCKKMLNPIHILITFYSNHANIIIFMAILALKKMLMCTHFGKGGGGLKKYVMYICENVDIFGQPLSIMGPQKVVLFDKWSFIRGTNI